MFLSYSTDTTLQPIQATKSVVEPVMVSRRRTGGGTSTLQVLLKSETSSACLDRPPLDGRDDRGAFGGLEGLAVIQVEGTHASPSSPAWTSVMELKSGSPSTGRSKSSRGK
eukprot:gnl/MRDRNA2_/MRDRNA2_525448_c0_seq1.p2 gnl/MRDRNA2_/MRDRNA2_525448_c0~~gnl/MRDRNA2_/MRDRNA2_525448_c0_seq1.p2  ORF type:complete len:111 (-),score=15.51 gnl/MRDRNA2_/MRDRNA2_525448_c0_seq1:12-344(-)